MIKRPELCRNTLVYRRLIAAMKAEVELVPRILTEGYLAQVYGFIEHLHHKRLNPIEEATGFPSDFSFWSVRHR